MIKHLNILNLFLFVGIFILLISLYQEYAAMGTVNIENVGVIGEDTHKDRKLRDTPLITNIAKIKNVQEFNVIKEKNLFHPERKAMKAKTAEVKQVRPDLVLYGTILNDGIRIAFVEDKRNPYSTRGRGKRQKALRVGDEVSGYSVAEITEDSIVLVGGEDRLVYTIKDSAGQKHRGASVRKKSVRTKKKKAPPKRFPPGR